mgnify:CR=1 FL=1
MSEKTYQVNIGEGEYKALIAMQQKVKEEFGYAVTQRAVVTRAIKKLHDEVCPRVVE